MIFRNQWKALGLLLFGIFITILATWTKHREVKKEAKKDFEELCYEIRTRVIEKVNSHTLLLHTATAFLESSDTVTNNEWKIFCEQANTGKLVPGIKGIGYIRIIPSRLTSEHFQDSPKKVGALETASQADDKAINTTVLYLEPNTPDNLIELGADKFKEPVSRKAMEDARDSDMATLTGMILNKSDTAVTNGLILMYVPVYKTGWPTNNLIQRQEGIKGWVFSPYRVNDLLQGILGHRDSPNPDKIHLQIYDGDLSSSPLLYDNQKGENNKAQRSSVSTMSLPASINSRNWILKISQEENSIYFFQQRSTAILFAGISISLLLFLLFLSLLNTSSRALKIAAKLTKELKESEEILQNSEIRFHLLLNAATEAIYEIDLEGNCVYCNQSALNMLGYSDISKVLGRNMHNLIHHSREDGSTCHLNDCHIFRSFREGKAFHADDEVFWTSEGKSFPVEYWSDPIFSEGRIKGSVVSFLDISARKITEERMRILSTAIEQSPVTIFITDPEGNIEYANHNTQVTTGYGLDELIGVNPRILKSGTGFDSDYKLLWETISTGKQWKGNFCNKNKSGEHYWVSCSISPITNREGRTTHYIAVQEDITERKKVNDELIASEANLKEANSTKDKLFSIIAHDLRGPIGNFEPILELLTSGEELEAAERDILLSGLLKGSKSAFNLLENLLGWARSQTNEIVLSPKIFEIQDVVKHNIDLLASTALQKNIQLSLNNNEKATAFADVDSINLVLRNLISNAIKFTHKNGLVTISISQEENLVKVKVADNGVGMKKEIADNLFASKSYYTTRGTDYEKGTGLGLILCRDFIAKNGGRIYVESIPEHGSTFIFTIPASGS